MAAQRTARNPHTRERQKEKAWARLALLTAVGLVCPPLAAARSGTVWGLYLAFLVLYALWTARLARSFPADRRLAYLLCITDGAVLVPLLVWTQSAAMRVVLVLVWGAGLAATCWAERTLRRSTHVDARELAAVQCAQLRPVVGRNWAQSAEAPLERSLRVRLRVLETTDTRFALVVLKVIGFEEMTTGCGDETTERMLAALGQKGLRLLGPDAQLFALPGGRVAFVFATGATEGGGSSAERDSLAWIDPYDVESLAMALGRRACEQMIDGRRLECLVGWASAPADGVSADDLMYAAEGGDQATAAFRRVAGSRIPVPETTRAVAG
jgi:hypothetical protein